MAKKRVPRAAAQARKPEGQVGELAGPVDPRARAALRLDEEVAEEEETETED